jgi:hypothetical protein
MNNYIEEYKRLLNANLEPPSNLKGNGLIFAMFEDNDRADIGIQIGLTLARQVGWQHEIQFWHVGHIPKIDPALDVKIIDAREVHSVVGGEFLPPWTLKSFAIRYSGLAKIQWLDWDAYNVRSTGNIFAALDNHTMITWHGDWSDRWGFNKEIHQAIIGRPSPLRPIQGGTYFLNCDGIEGWKLLTLQRYCDDNYKWWYPANRNSDEEAWRLSIAATNANYIEGGKLDWHGPAWWNHWQGEVFFVHRCNGKLWSDCIPDWDFNMPLEKEVQELYFKLKKDGGYNLKNRYCGKQPISTKTREEKVQEIRNRVAKLQKPNLAAMPKIKTRCCGH